ncbi:MAG: peptidoglycan-binding protein [Candidatus Improbicoccus pseudotrichonymphae]|uniref:Peptidoglycan-binding protein n=1 Tax=Candidatus Improbicoccus pseudotrichonymphae TaxID=3033792 RepID=A0AA48HYZ2_9FIRM|nr:MAG: peptidoglycan-binding protein [Candidatus Improbicoccus pseudotrichonymphae]
MAIGNLRVKIFNGNVGSPMSNIRFQVRKTDTENIIAENVTDDSGQSELIELSAPPVNYSLEPESPRPYDEYDVIMDDVTGFEKIIINRIQILPDSISDQNIYLTPAKDYDKPELTYDIQAHTLFGNYPSKITEEEVKPLPNPTGFVVLDSPIIPEFIVVHDGAPTDDSAADYWIPYKDYIKNVCSSEVYPTWPENSIKANVLAIISFTLNRVYTEWYRSRGYGFTITSSTAYDQKFIYQRNIFENISRIVDEIFSTYITKPNIEQPLFSQYCDGKRVTCPNWLSQWGSKYLADNGADYVNILKNYYGYEIYLEMAKEVAGVPISFPGEILQIGSSGSSVRTIQQQLNAISNNYPAIKKVAVDGVYGESTSTSVKTFQKIFGLSQTGSVNYATWYELSKIYVAVKKLS